ncbi:O-acetyl-ADP-ribose deacetylase [compost metagenome]
MKIADVEIEVIMGDITDQPDITAIVNAANAHLLPGGGVAGAIHRKAGPDLEKEARQYAPIKPGEAVITKAYNLPNQYVIHCLGPIYGTNHPEELLLANCYRNAIKLAEEYKIDSIAFPAISTGIFGYPFEAAADIVVSVMRESCPETKHLKLVRFVLFNTSDLSIYRKKFHLPDGNF